jgi:hypothetical protein
MREKVRAMMSKTLRNILSAVEMEVGKATDTGTDAGTEGQDCWDMRAHELLLWSSEE